MAATCQIRPAMASASQVAQVYGWLKRARANARARRTLAEVDARILVLGQPLDINPLTELERRVRQRRREAIPEATARWLHDRAFTHPTLDRP